MTTSVMASIPDDQPVRKILGWLDDDDDRGTTADGVVEVSPGIDDAAFGEGVLVVAPADADVLLSRPPVKSAGALIPLVLGRGYYKVRKSDDESGIGSRAKHIVVHGMNTFGTAEMGPAWTRVGVEPDWVFTAPAIAPLIGHHDFYSSVLPELAQIELTIESIHQTMRESMRTFVSAFVRDHSDTYFGSAGEAFESTGLAYTDHLGEYPPLTRVYEDVDVVMGTEDEIERPVYTDEDYQVWGT